MFESEIAKVSCKYTLKPHQIALVQTCLRMEAACAEGVQLENPPSTLCSRIGVMCDRPGSGKTISALYLTALSVLDPAKRAPPPLEVHQHNFIDNMLSTRVASKYTKRMCDIYVVPHVLAQQWHGAIYSFPGLKYDIVRRQDHLYTIMNGKALEGIDLLIITNTQYQCLAVLMEKHKLSVRRVFYDDAAMLDIPDSIQVKCDFVWFISSMYNVLQRPYGESNYHARVEFVQGMKASGFLRNVFHRIGQMPANEKSFLFVRNDDELMETSCGLPPIESTTIMCFNADDCRNFAGMVGNKRLAEKIKMDDLQGAINMLPLVVRDSEENICTMFTAQTEGAIHVAEVELAATEAGNSEMTAERAEKIRQLTSSIDRLRATAGNIAQRIKAEEGCPICYKSFDVAPGIGKLLMCCCQQAVCLRCTHEWLCRHSHRCPACNTQVIVNPAFMVVDSERVAVKEKLQTLFDIVEAALAEDSTRRFVVVSSVPAVLDRVQGRASEKRIFATSCVGNGSAVDNNISSFRNGAFNIMLMNPSNSSYGFNLEFATDVVLMHRMTASVEEHAIGSAQRIGRTRPLRVWRLLYDSEA